VPKAADITNPFPVQINPDGPSIQGTTSGIIGNIRNEGTVFQHPAFPVWQMAGFTFL